MISRLRLHNANRKAKRRMERFRRDPDVINDIEWITNQLRILRNVTKRCSGPCCGNPRRHFGEKSIQERKQNQIVHERYNMDKQDKPTKGSFTVKRMGVPAVIWFDAENRKVGAVIKEEYVDALGVRTFKGLAVCSKEDEFNVKYGATLALKRALGQRESYFISTLRRLLSSHQSKKAQITKSFNDRLNKIVPDSAGVKKS